MTLTTARQYSNWINGFRKLPSPTTSLRRCVPPDMRQRSAPRGRTSVRLACLSARHVLQPPPDQNRRGDRRSFWDYTVERAGEGFPSPARSIYHRFETRSLEVVSRPVGQDSNPAQIWTGLESCPTC